MKRGSSQILLVITCIVLGISVFVAATIASMKRGDEGAEKQGFSLVAEAPLAASAFASGTGKGSEETTTAAEKQTAKEELSTEAASAAEAASREVSADMIALQETEEAADELDASEEEVREAEEEAARLAAEEAARAAEEEAARLAAEEAARAAEEEAARLAEEAAREAEEEAARLAAEEAARAAEEEAARLAAEEAARAAEEEAARLAAEEAARLAEEEAARLAAEAAEEEIAAQTVDNSSVTYSGDYDYSADAAAYAISGGVYGYSFEETYLLACTVSAEVGWSPYETQLAVANVILDRAANTGSIRSAVFAAGQFAVTWDGALLRTFRSGPRDSALQSTIDALNGTDLRPRPYYYFNNRDMSGEFEGVVGEWIGDGYFYLIE